MTLTDLIGRSVEDAEVAAFVEGTGETPELDESGERIQFSFPLSGMLWTVDPKGVITTVYLQAPAELPAGLDFGMPRAAIRAALGAPSLWHDGEPAWDRFDTPAYCIHVRYQRDAAEIVTLMSPQPPPRF